jgi:hypothetical protein
MGVVIPTLPVQIGLWVYLLDDRVGGGYKSPCSPEEDNLQEYNHYYKEECTLAVTHYLYDAPNNTSCNPMEVVMLRSVANYPPASFA